MRRFIAVSLILALALIGVTAAFAAWLVYTPGGLLWLTSRASQMTGGALALDQPAGTLAHGVTLMQLEYQAPTLSVRAEDVTLRLRPMSLLWLTPHIEQLNALKLVIRTIPAADAPNEPLEVPALPVAIRADAIRIAAVEIDRGSEPIRLEDVFLSYAADAAQHEVRKAALRAHGFAIGMEGRIATAAPYPLTGTVTVEREQGAPDVKASVELSGNLETLSVALAGVLAGAQVKASGDIEPGSDLPLASVEARFEAFDARVLDAALPQTALSGDIKLARANGTLYGNIEVQNALSGPYSDQRVPVSTLRSSVLTDLTTVEFKELVAMLHGGGTLSGSATLGTGSTTLALAARNIDLRALHERLHATQLTGRLDGALTPERQSVTADLTQDDLRLRFGANLEDDTVTLHDATLYARGGEAEARGSVSLSDTQPFSARVEFRNFDPAAWGDFPAGSINGALTGQGTVAGPSAKAQFDIAKSRLRNAPLAGGGKITLQGSRLSAADFNIRLGNNRADVKGAFGAPKDTLQIRFDAPELAIIHDAVQGRMKGEAHIAGGLGHPTVRFDAQASAFRVAGASVQHATASGTLAREPHVPLRLTARLKELSYQGRQVEKLVVELTGPQSDHALAVKAQGPEYEVQARARGAWNMQKRTWSGTLLELLNRGTLDAALEGPLKVVAAPDRVMLGRSAIRVLDGRVELEELTYRPGHLSTSGQFSKLPAIRLANVLQREPRVSGDLRLSGAWSLVQDGALTGSLAVKRDAGDIMLGVNGGLPMQLQAFSAQARLDRTRLEIQASIRSATASAEGSGTLGVVPGSGVIPIHGDSPLRASVRVSISELAAVARLLDANALVNGALQGTLSMTGTLGRPVVNGEVQGDRLAYALPPQGVHLRNGTLRATVNDRTVRVEAFSIRSGDGVFTARGNVGFNGAGATLDWQADRLLLLARPDRRLVVSGKGRAGLVDGTLSFSGGVQVNDGYFEIGPDALPEPGADVIIAGQQPRMKEQSPLARMLLELVVNLGDNLRIRGHGIDTRLAGEIVVATKPGQALQAKGTVRTVRGVYTVLGQRLEIDRGELLFSGPIDNPGLDIRAMRKRQAVEAGVEVTGTLNAPRARIVSDPPVAENEAISWLVLGHGTADASRGDLAMLPLAASSLLSKGNSRTLAQRLGLDTLGLRGAGGENQFVTVGKRIADRLYVAFEQSLGAAQSILKLEFDLTDRILLRAQTGEANAVGVFYRYTFD
jgi:translocation and assembly module TamB